MPRFRIASTFCGLLALWFSTASALEAPHSESHSSSDGPAIWKITDEDTTIYLFGTVHILSKDIKWRTESFNKLWESAETVYFETDTSPAAQSGMQKLIMSHGMNEEGTTLSSFFTEQELALISEEVTRVGLQMQNLEPFRPWFASVTLSVMQIIAAGGDPTAGVDTILGEDARNSNKNMRFFETAEEQIGFFANFPDSIGAKMMVDGIKQSKEHPNFFTELVDDWKNGDLKNLQVLLNDAMKSSDPVIAETILYSRNAKWADSIAAVMDDESGTFFVAVGAAHLIGEKSLQEYLSEKGFEADRL